MSDKLNEVPTTLEGFVGKYSRRCPLGYELVTDHDSGHVILIKNTATEHNVPLVALSYNKITNTWDPYLKEGLGEVADEIARSIFEK